MFINLAIRIGVTLLAAISVKSLSLKPSSIHFRGVSQSYPETLFRTLFSSVPRRQFAVQNLSFEIHSGDFLLILGASSSGKSTILRLVQKLEIPISGTILLNSTSTPVYLDSKPECTNQNAVESHYLSHETTRSLFGALICNAIGLDVQKKLSDLSPSEVYKYGLLVACLESIHWQDPCAPIILMDEWMDLETSIVVHKVEDAIEKLNKEFGIVVMCVTHKPNLFRNPHLCYTMCRGEILARVSTKSKC
jgi:energy-coupling factor transporter ATP-binding protein EcfA2